MSTFALSTVPPFLDGVYLAVNAIPDAYLLIDCPSGCFFKCERIAINHDATSTLFDPLGRHRIVQSGITFTELTMGSEAVIAPLVERVVETVRPPALFLSQASSVAMTSNDLQALADRLGAATGVPVVYVAPDTFEGDWLDGFERVLGGVVSVAEALGPLPRPEGDGAPAGDVALVGYLADRLEGDHRANLAEVERLLAALGVRLAGTLCGGAPLAELRRAMAAPVLLALPYDGGAAARIAARTGATVVSVDLPLGLGGTAAWLETVGAALGKADEAARLVEQELARHVPAVELARARFLKERRVAIAADPALAAGLARFLIELGLEVPVVSVRTRRRERAELVAPAVAEALAPPRVLHDAPVEDLHRTIEALPADERPDLLVASTLERDVARDLALGYVELGYPSYLVHAFAPRPYLGFAGALHLVDELVRAIQAAGYAHGGAATR